MRRTSQELRDIASYSQGQLNNSHNRERKQSKSKSKSKNKSITGYNRCCEDPYVKLFRAISVGAKGGADAGREEYFLEFDLKDFLRSRGI